MSENDENATGTEGTEEEGSENTGGEDKAKYVLERKTKQLEKIQKEKEDLENELQSLKTPTGEVDIYKAIDDLSLLQDRIKQEPFIAAKGNEIKKLMRQNPKNSLDEVIIKAYGSLSSYNAAMLEYQQKAEEKAGRTTMTNGYIKRKQTTQYKPGMTGEERAKWKRDNGLA